MRGRTLVLSSFLLMSVGSWGCKVSVGDGDLDSNTDELERGDAGDRQDGGAAGKNSKPPKAGSGSTSTADGGVAGSGAKAGSGSKAGTSGGAGTGSSSGPVPGTTKLSDLDNAKATAVCEQFAGEISEIVTDAQVAKVNCTLDALFISLEADPQTGEYIVDVAACQQEADDCIEQGLGEGTTECDVAELVSMTAACDATVDEYLECQRGLAEQYSDAADQFTCAAFADPMVAEEAVFAVDPDEVPACVTLVGKCPELGSNDG